MSIVSDKWDELKETMIPVNAPQVQLDEMKKSFYWRISTVISLCQEKVTNIKNINGAIDILEELRIILKEFNNTLIPNIESN